MNTEPAPGTSPMMLAYAAAQAAAPHHLVLYRVGEFYEVLGRSAETVSRALGMQMTRRRQKGGDDVPMCGIPASISEQAIARLLAAGHKIAVSEQSPEGEGEWKVRKHGADKRRVWRKMHLAIDADSHEVRAVEVTDHRHGNGEIVPDLLAQLPSAERIGIIGGDGARDTRGVYEACVAREAALVLPPRRIAKPWKTRTAGAQQRNESLRAIRRLGRRPWKHWSGYHRRSLGETAMSRLKRLGERLWARDPAHQVAEVQSCCAILNTFNRLGMPQTIVVV